MSERQPPRPTMPCLTRRAVCSGEARAPQRRTLHTGGSAEYSPAHPCVRRVCLPTALRAGGRARSVRSRLRGLTAHTARVPAVPREYRVSAVGGAAVKITNGLIATASWLYSDYNRALQLRPLSLHYGFHPIATASVALNRSIVAHCSYSVCGFIAITIAHYLQRI
jgi:hypothetical protein